MKEIKGYEGLYWIDEFGNITNRFGRTVHPWVNNDHKGYLRVSLSKNNKPRKFLVHVLVAMHYLDDYDESLNVDHIVGHLNNHYTNLQMKTLKENNELASQREREKGGNQKHSDDLVRLAIEMSQTMSTDKVGEILGISGRTVRRYKSGTSRKFVGSGKVQRLSDMEYAPSGVEVHDTQNG